jgi:acetylornithine deacetylase/succinyl-diaminopimelate desuccinylase-like protein
MRTIAVAATIALLVATNAPAPRAAVEPPSNPELARLGLAVSTEALKATVSGLVAFGTRHTLSDTQSPTRGIGAARRWVKGRFESLGAACGGCLAVETPEQTVTGPRIPKPAVIQDVIAIQRGTRDPDRVVIISGHIDSRVTDILDFTKDAPGANDDGSGTAAVIEAARVLSRRRFPATIVYAVLSGEEQGLYGGKLLADYAKSKGWRVEAVLNNDIIGNTYGLDGRVEADAVRVFSEGTRAGETAALASTRRREGGEFDAPSRNLSRFMAGIAKRYMPGFSVRQIMRPDRFSRGGDQGPMQEAGYPAVRVTEADENYTRQHQDVRTEGGVHYGDVIDGVDFAYLTKVTRLNILTLAALAAAPPPPTHLKISGAVTADTTLSWTASPGAVRYRAWWRETTDPLWRRSQEADGATSIVLKGVNIDDYFFGVSAISADGYESPVEFPGPAGAFFAEAER